MNLQHRLITWLLRKYHFMRKHGLKLGFIEKKISAIMNAKRFKERSKYFDKLRILFKSDSTIICNNCFGGRIYQDLGYKYNSPTVGLGFTNEGYDIFISNLDKALSSPITMSYKPKYFPENKNRSIPFGILTIDNYEIEIRFTHYNTIEEAKEKWIRRCNRVNRDNIIVLYAPIHDPSEESAKKLFSLPYTKKVAYFSFLNFEIEDSRFCHIAECEQDGFMAPYQDAHLLYKRLVDVNWE